MSSDPLPQQLNSFSSVPDSLARPLTTEGCFKHNDAQESVPVIDLTDPNASQLLAKACETWGMFQVVGHGIPIEQMDQVVSEANRLFALPLDQKNKACRVLPDMTGYGAIPLPKFDGKEFSLEGFTMLGPPHEYAKKIWPDDYHNFSDIMEDFRLKMKEEGIRLSRLILESFDIPEEKLTWLDKPGYTGWHFNHYPACPNSEQAVGLAAHTDITLLTFVHESNANGLQVFKQGLGWVPIIPEKGGFIVNAGDYLQVLSNNRFTSALHRVLLNETKYRLSIAYHFGIPPEVDLSPPSEVLECTGGVHRFRSMTAGEYLALKLKDVYKDPFALLGI